MNRCRQLFIFSVIFSITGVFSFLSNDDDIFQSTDSKITLNEVLSGKFIAETYNGEWISDNEIRTISSKGKVTVTDVETNVADEKDFTLHIDKLMGEKNSTFSSLSVSPDGKFILIAHARSNLWRYSFLAKYDILNTITNVTEALQPTLAGEQPKLQLVRWSPTGNALVFVYENDIYYRYFAGEDTQVKRITLDGEANSHIFNGHTDWVYEEEMFGTNSALWFSPDGARLAYVKFNDEDVEKYTFTKYGEPGNKETVYPEQITIHYPKAGRPNPKYSVFIVSNLTAANPVSNAITFNTTIISERDYHYIATAVWATNTDFVVVTLDRIQSSFNTYRCTSPPTTGDCKIIGIHSYYKWENVLTPKFNVAATSYLSLEYTRQVISEPWISDSYIHIVVKNATSFDWDDMDNKVPLTSGLLNVKSILGWDEENHKIYFSGTYYKNNPVEIDPSQTQIYVVDDDPTTKDLTCITCGFTNVDYLNETCLSNSATFSPTLSHYIHRCLGPNIPTTVVRRTWSDTVIVNAVENSPLRQTLRDKILPIRRDITIEFPSTTLFNAKVRLLLPPDFNENSNKTYPLLIDAYAGPGSQKVGQDYAIDWGTSLVTGKDIIYGYIDARGSGQQGYNCLKDLYMRLGTVEIDDQIDVTKQLFGKYKFIDPTRTAIWGWSYGGYTTAMVMSKDTEGIFKCGISVAPITSWLYYDSIYTERYMLYPTTGSSGSDNWDGYNRSDVTNKVENFRNKNFLLIHGNADDSVHYQQSMLLARALEQNDIMFQQLSYPDENHGINGPGMRKHLYHSMEKFLFSSECFGDVKREEQETTTTKADVTTGTPGSSICMKSNSPIWWIIIRIIQFIICT